MRKQITSLASAMLFGWLLGCNSNPVQAPDQIPGQDSPTGQQIQVLELPVSADLNLAKKYSVQSWISANSGGQLDLSAKFGTATLTASLVIPGKALSQSRNIFMTFNDSRLQLTFQPEGLQFNLPAELTYTATGLNLSSLPTGTEIKLYYYNQKTRMFEEMHSESITYDIASGTVTCLNAEIPHFSEYAFGYIKKLADDDPPPSP